MTAKEMIDKALILLGYDSGDGSVGDARFSSASKSAVNFVLNDITHCLGLENYTDISDISTELQLPKRVLYDVFPYGVAAFIAANIGDSDKQQYFAAIYNMKRKTVTYTEQVQDVIPAP